MVLAILGTHSVPFDRLINYLENSNIEEEILILTSKTSIKPKKCKIIDYIPYEEMDTYIDKATLIITSGTGSIMRALKKGKKVIICPRLAKYGEAVDDHGKDMKILAEKGYALYMEDDINIDDIYNQSKNFKPKKYKSNTKKIKNYITNYIDNT